jgi:ubiquitin C-terminal hydrolase
MEDAYEAITLIFRSVISAAQGVVSEETPIDRLLGITINRRQTCMACNAARGTIAQDTALEFIVVIPAPAIQGAAVSLYDCLATRTEPEGIDAVYCNACGARNFAVFQPTRISVGDVFFVVLRRFDGHMNKINTEVDIPLVLDMARVTLDANVPNYNLVGVVHHLGSCAHTGHYVTEYFDSEKNEWVRANDGSVTALNGPPQSVSQSAYLLIYERPLP